MISFKSKIGFFIIALLVFNAIVSPFYINAINSPIDSKSLANLELPLANAVQAFSSNQITEEVNFNTNNIQKSGIFDDLLLNDLLDKEHNPESRVIILFKEGTSKSIRAELIESIFDNFEIIYNYDIISALYLKCDTEELINQKANIEELTNIDKIFKSKIYSLPFINEDIPSSSALNKDLYPNWWVPAVGADDLIYNGTGIKVGVIDTGIYEHPDLTIGYAKNFVTDELSTKFEDDIGHGTHVAGIIGGDGGASNGLYRGIAPGVTLVNARAGDINGLDEGDVISAIEWCVNVAAVDIISMSFGDTNPLANDPMILALSAATDSGVICVASAGNSGPRYLSGGSPASGMDVIAVGATDSNNNLAFFSSRGPTYSYLHFPDIVAPGVNIISTEAPKSVISDEKRFVGDYFDFAGDADYIPLSGTSMSCPVVSGAVAILKQRFPSITPETARIALLEGARKLSNDQDNQALNSGFGIINISQSLDYLNLVNTTHSDINDISLIAPHELPVAPLDLLHFPGDSQLYNLSIISGSINTYDLNFPSDINGLTITLDKSHLSFSEPGIAFAALSVKINHDAQPGIRSFILNISSGLDLYDEINFSIDIIYPEYRILLDSFHGLNDWDPTVTFYQMYFYDWMKDITEMNVAIDYLAEYWTPNYDKLRNNSILTTEKLAQYDLVILQNPILPYAYQEINNLKNYFDDGGNILFLGTRYQDMCIENVNTLFTTLGVDIQINNDNLIDETWLGIGASVNPQLITEFNDSIIFNDVTNFLWNYGSVLTVTDAAKSIATKNENTVAASYDGNSFGKGKFIIFGDLHWASTFYKSASYYSNHKTLTHNLMNYFFDSVDISLDILLNSPSSSDSKINISIFAKDRVMDTLIDSTILNAYLNVSINNGAFYDEILTNSLSNGRAFNYSYLLPFTSPNPYEINVNITINSQTFKKTSKYLYFNDSEIPKIINVSSNSDIERNGIDTLNIDTFLDAINYESNLYLAIYPSSYYSKAETINKTLTLNNSHPNQLKYSASYSPVSSDPAGLVIFFIFPRNPSFNYTNPYSPRLISLIINNPPKFNEDTSTFSVDNAQPIKLSDTHDNQSLIAITTSQTSVLTLNMNVSDSVNFEDQNSSNMIVSVNFLMAAISLGNTIVPLDPAVYIYSILSYDGNSKTQKGSFTIPFQMKYSSITGTKSISTLSDYNSAAQDGYLGLILIKVFDSDGGSDEFLVVFIVQQGVTFDLILILLIIGVIIAVGISFIVISHKRKKRRSKVQVAPAYYLQQEPGEVRRDESTIGNRNFCPFCGEGLTGLRNFCPSCGKSLNFEK
jgi:serine protease AprX